MTARHAAIEVLVAVERGRTTLAAEIERVRGRIHDDRDRALLVELTTGTLRWLAELDAQIQPHSRRALDTLAPAIRAILRVAVYQLAHLDRIPPHAVLNESVDLTRVVGEPRASGFVNAVLRSVQRTPRSSVPARPGEHAAREAQSAYLATALSHPRWLVERWLDRHGFGAAEAWCQFNNSSPEITIRSAGRVSIDVLLESLRAAGIDAAPARFVRDAATLPPGGLGRVPIELAEDLFVQDEASQLVARAVQVEPGQRVLDMCAAPGGKTLVMHADMAGHGVIVAADFRSSRVRLLKRTIARAGAPAMVVSLDGTRPLPFGAVFDRVFIDAPCSGLGVLRRDPDVKWTRQEGDLPRFAAAQLVMLRRASEAVAPGGRLIYATCSSEPDENDAVVDAFLSENAEFAPHRIDPGPLVAGADAVIGADGRLRTLPFRDRLDAFFAAALTRRS